MNLNQLLEQPLPKFPGDINKKNQVWVAEETRRYAESVKHWNGLWLNPVDNRTEKEKDIDILRKYLSRQDAEELISDIKSNQFNCIKWDPSK